MNAKIMLLAVAVAIIGAGALLMCDDSEAATGDVLKSGSCGTSLTYEVRSLNADDSQAEIVISGNGNMTNWQYYNDVPWYTYNAQIMTATLPEGLTSIGKYAFLGCTNLALTELPAGVTSIGQYAFSGCTNLALTELPAGVTSIGEGAFSRCTNLALTELPAGVTSIGNSMFEDCTNLALTELPAGVTSIGQYAFSRCTNLALTELPAGVTSIGQYAFRGCANLALTELPAGVTILETNAFSGCTNLALTELPAGVTSIGGSAFSGCTNLALTELPAGVTSIGGSAFSGCTNLALTELPAGVTSIGSQAFIDCKSIKTMTMPAVITTSSIHLNYLESLTYTSSADWTNSNKDKTPQFSSRATLQSITFADDRIPAYALYAQSLDRLTITNAAGADVFGIYTAPNTKATASALTVDGTAAYIVRLTDVAGTAELVDGGITANDAVVSWTTTPDGYATGPVDASPEVLIYPAGIHTSAPNQYAGLINAIPLIVIVAIITTIIGIIAIRRD